MTEATDDLSGLFEDRSEPSKGILRLVRRFPASQRALFEAFSKVEQVEAWFGPQGLRSEVSEFDLRPGGRYSLAMLGEGGQRHELSGVFREVEPFERLSYSWQWGGENPSPETFVTLEFKAIGDMTELTLTHSLHASEESVSNHTRGWTSSFEKLAALVGG